MISVDNLLKRGALLTLAGVAAVSLGLSHATVVSAQEVQDGSGNSTIKVTPLRSDIELNPGETRTVKVTVSNPTSQDLEVRPIQNDFMAEDEKGTPAIILDEEEYAPKHSLKRFMTPLDNFILPGDGSMTIDVELVVPANAEPGGYFGAIRFDPVDQSSGGQVNLNTSVASLILARVKGDTPERLTLSDFEVQQKGRTSSWYMDDQDLSVLVRFENSSAVQLSPMGKVSVLKGDDIVYESDFNDSEVKDVILPDSARRWTIPVEELDGFGKYTAVATFTYGETNQVTEVEYSFWIIPRGMIIGAVVGLVVLVLAIVGLVIHLKNRGNSSRPTKGRGRH